MPIINYADDTNGITYCETKQKLVKKIVHKSPPENPDETTTGTKRKFKMRKRFLKKGEVAPDPLKDKVLIAAPEIVIDNNGIPRDYDIYKTNYEKIFEDNS